MQRKLNNYLKKYFNYSHFLKGQKEIILDLLNGKNVLGILPTGSGKSLCYQLPAKLLNGTTIVISPLVSLMIDQVKQLKAMQFKDVATLNSLIDYNERKYILNNLHNYSLIYISPEFLQNKMVFSYFKHIHIDLFVIDEAHCISEWGHEFRPDYLKLPEIIQAFNKPPVLAITATAPKKVQEDIIQLLQLKDVKKHIYPIDRSNIALVVEEVIKEHEKNKRMVELLQMYRIPTLIYFLSRKKSESIASQLKQNLPNRRIAFYHGGMDRFDRISIQQQFMNDEIDIICCTSAFGMGINKKNIRLIMHYHLPTGIESFIQEIGRAGRDGKQSMSISFYNDRDIYHSLNIIKQQLPDQAELKRFFNFLYLYAKKNSHYKLDEKKLQQMVEIDEVKLRFLFYQLGRYGIISEDKMVQYDKRLWHETFTAITQFIKIRQKQKESNLNKMVHWLKSKNCLRKVLYESFQSTFTRPEKQCCSICNVSFNEWQPKETNVSLVKETSWQAKLANILQVGGTYEYEAT